MEKSEYAIKRLELRLYELSTFRLLKKIDIDNWLFSSDSKDWQEVHLGDKWPKQGFPCYFKREFYIPNEWKGLSVALQLWVDGEGIVYINNKPIGGLDPNHREFKLLERSDGGEHFYVLIEAVPRGPFGSHLGENRLSQASIVAVDEGVEASLFDLLAVLDAAKNLPEENELRGFLIRALDEALSSVRFLSNTEEYLRIAAENPFAQKMIFRVWNPPIPKLPEIVNPEEVRTSIIKAKEKLSLLIEEIKKKYPPVGNITLTGHSHIDLAWLWPMAETRRKIRRTTSTVLSLMERYPEFRYNQSSAQVYAFLKEDEPELYERVKEKIRSGMWEPIGGMWVESDCNLTSGESLVRQTLYAQKFFEKEFGKRCKVAWLPDAFGFTWTLPQILKKAGLDYFLTTKINWNETNKFPYDLFYWQALDGTRVIAHSFLNPGQGYNGDIRALDLLGTWQNYREKTLYYNTLLSFGYGDGGGGPTLEMLEMYKRFRNFPGYPNLKMGIVEEYFENAPKDGLPLWDGELYLELHRGTYTTQARMKKANRLAEHLLYTSEVLSTISYLLGRKHHQEELTSNWQKVLRNQFHDILPGSSIKEVYEDALRELKEVEDSSRVAIENALEDITSEIKLNREGIVIFNPNSFPRALCYIGNIPYSSVELPDGRAIKVQRLFNGEGLVYSPDIEVPPVGYLVLYSSNKDRGDNKLTITSALLENEKVKVKIGEDGTIISFLDKLTNREIFSDRGNQIWAYSDRPRDWDAWDVSPDYERYGEEVKDVEYISVLEKGPSRGVVEIKKRYRDSIILQRYILYQDNPRLDIETEIDWHERRILLKALFPIDVRSSYATYEIAYGNIQRPTHKNTSWDSARFEVPGHRWVDLSEGNYGVSLLNDGKYGYSANENTIGISLLRSPIFPDFLADEGKHMFTYSILPHQNDWRNSTIKEAISLNTPLIGINVSAKDGSLNGKGSFLEIDNSNVILGALKKAEDDDAIVARFYEAYGFRGKVKIRCNFDIKRVAETNLLEDEIIQIEPVNNEIEVFFKPYEIKTLKLYR